MSDIVVEHLDSVDIRIQCDRSIAKELSDFFTFKVPGHQYMPAYRNKIWDGQIKLYNIYKQTLYAGLIEYVEKFARDRKYSITVPEESKKKWITQEHMKRFIDDYLQPHASGSLIKAHDHQVVAATHAINRDRCLLLSPTGSGKSLIIYTLIRYYLDKIAKDKKILIIVPTTSLVSQMYSDFKDYSSTSDWDVEENCHTIFAGREKQTDKRVVISTWQSIYKLPQKYFDQYSCVIGDECHLFKSKSLTTLMTKLTQCPYRVGTTGTLDGTMTHKLVIEGLFGPVFNVTSTKNLMDKELLSALKIESILLKYPSEIREHMKRAKYQDEIDWIVRNEKRNDFIKNMALSLKGNTLVLFQFVEKHGKHLHSIVEDAAEKNRPIFFIYGGTDVEMREKVRHITEKESNAIIVASYGTFSTGISIRKLHNIIFASPSKSRIRVLQSIGRQLRKSEHKDIAKLYDIGDDLSWKAYKNHTLKHFEERVKIYKSENFDYDIVSVNI
tara:strand:- start:15654 stop:17147 length:1494 start_codon:yes stop_codon:yes gene_type:complete